MELWHIIVALIQGLAEWLPISSEGQLLFYISNFTNVSPEDMLSLVVWLHLGTSLAVVVRYPRIFRDLISLKDRVLLKRLIIATIGTAVTAIPLYIFLKSSISLFQGMMMNILVGGLLLVTAVILYLPTRQTTDDSDAITSQCTGNIFANLTTVRGHPPGADNCHCPLIIGSELPTHIKDWR